MNNKVCELCGLTVDPKQEPNYKEYPCEAGGYLYVPHKWHDNHNYGNDGRCKGCGEHRPPATR